MFWLKLDQTLRSIFLGSISTQGTWPSSFLFLQRYSSVGVQKMTSSMNYFVLFSILINSIKAQNCEDIILEGCHSCGSCDTLFELEAENAAECQEKCTFLRLSKKYCKYFEFFENKVPTIYIFIVQLPLTYLRHRNSVFFPSHFTTVHCTIARRCNWYILQNSAHLLTNNSFEDYSTVGNVLLRWCNGKEADAIGFSSLITFHFNRNVTYFLENLVRCLIWYHVAKFKAH